MPNYSKKPLIWILAGISLLGVGVVAQNQNLETKSTPTASTEVIPVTTVTALGRLEPQGEVIRVSTGKTGDKIAEMRVKEGDKLKKEDIIAVLASHAPQAAALKQVEAQLTVAKAQLNQVKAGAKSGEIQAQKAAIARLEIERENNLLAATATVKRQQDAVNNAKIEYQRYEQLYQAGAVSASARDTKKLTWDTSRRQLEEAQATLDRIDAGSKKQLEEAKATLDRIAEVRDVDVEVAVAAVEEAAAAVQQAEAELELTYVKAPQAGEILDILAYPGEVVGSEGVVKMGQIEQMYAIAEVYESDIPKVKIGQKATITSNAVAETLTGTVEEIGREVKRQEVINTDPAANIDAKVIEVKIRLDAASSKQVSNLTNLLVQATIQL